MSGPRTVQVGLHAGRRRLDAGRFSITEVRYGTAADQGRHSHSRDVLAFALEGTGRLAFRGRDEACGPLALSSLPAGEPHRHLIDDTRCRFLVLECGPSEPAGPVGSIFDRPRILRGGPIAAFGFGLLRAFEDGDDLSAATVEQLLDRLDQLVVGESRRCPGEAGWLDRIRDRIHDDCGRRLVVADLAREVGVHPGYLVRAFRLRFGVPPATYARRVRLDIAVRLLAESALPLSAIASRCGFADQSQLTRHFTSYVGRSPGAFRIFAKGLADGRTSRPPDGRGRWGRAG